MKKRHPYLEEELDADPIKALSYRKKLFVLKREVLDLPFRALINPFNNPELNVKLFNISTAAAFVAAAAGAKVAKHGNRKMTSFSGSADVLEAAGVALGLRPEQIATCINEIGIGFMFASAHHSAMRFAAPVRQEIGIRTMMNVLGPMTNPASARRQVIGVFDHIQYLTELHGALRQTVLQTSDLGF